MTPGKFAACICMHNLLNDEPPLHGELPSICTSTACGYAHAAPEMIVLHVANGL